MKTSGAILVLIGAILTSSCGGGGGSPGTCNGSAAVCYGSNGTTSGSSVTADGPQGTPDSLANICTPSGEKVWVRAHLDDVYLWYKEIVNLSAASYSTPQDYFNALLVKSRDRFSFTASQSEIDGYFQSGEDIGYGMSLVNSSGNLRVTYVQPNSPAAQQNIGRGAQIVGINGVAITQLNAATQIAALYPSLAGAINKFDILDTGTSIVRTVQITSTKISKLPVLQSTILTTNDNKKIGYLVFTDHIATAEDPLVTSLQNFRQNGIDELVLDMRYNGGGYLYIADILASMIGGKKVENQIFEQLQFNDKHPEKTNNPDNKFSFSTTGTKNQLLPQLSLSRVFILTTANTCSASEAVINGLSPFVQVITVGSTTCGKPTGFVQTNNCGTAYFAIQFSGVNSIGKGDYNNGFTPTCNAPDDLDHDLGSVSERQLSSALAYVKTGSCPAVSAAQKSMTSVNNNVIQGEQIRYPWRQNRILNK
ncbi:S41 family peptidase [Undibacterium sp. RuTC16W]|uniref:S41 family peptidase n=1 Tax=Undibacterium sp. RuTC16W TaxID=3413048 RepID=UPI003BF029CB